MYKTHIEIVINNNDITKFEKERSRLMPLIINPIKNTVLMTFYYVKIEKSYFKK